MDLEVHNTRSIPVSATNHSDRRKNNVAKSIIILRHGQFFLWPSASFAW